MAGIEGKSQQSDERSAERGAYLPPKLKEFGPVGKLTQAGTGGTSEVMGNGMLSMSTNQQRP